MMQFNRIVTINAPMKAAALACVAALISSEETAAASQQKIQPPTTSQEQGMNQRNTIPKDVKTKIIAVTEEEKQRAGQLIEIYNILSEGPTPAKLAPYLSENYIQHSTMVPDGYVGLAMIFARTVAQYPFDVDVHRIMVVGDWAMAHVNFRNLDTTAPDDLGTAAVDIYLFGPDGKIVEHWDVLQTVPTHSANPNGMFLQVYKGE